MQLLTEHLQQIQTLCNKHRVKSLFAFGSVTNPNFKPESDVDFVVDIDAPDPIEYTNHYFELKFSLQDILHRDVDLLEEESIRNPILQQEIDRTKILVYGK